MNNPKVSEELKNKLGSIYYMGLLTVDTIRKKGSYDWYKNLQDWWGTDTYKKGMKMLTEQRIKTPNEE